MVASLLTGGTSPSPIRPPLSGLPNTTTTFEVSFMNMIKSKVVCRIWPFRLILWYDKFNSFLGYINEYSHYFISFIFTLNNSLKKILLWWIFVCLCTLFFQVIKEYRNVEFLLKGYVLYALLKPNFFCILFNIAFKHGRKTLTFFRT